MLSEQTRVPPTPTMLPTVASHPLPLVAAKRIDSSNGVSFWLVTLMFSLTRYRATLQNPARSGEYICCRISLLTLFQLFFCMVLLQQQVSAWSAPCSGFGPLITITSQPQAGSGHWKTGPSFQAIAHITSSLYQPTRGA